MIKYSVAIYGSSTRENFDKYSDKDILIVAETFEELKVCRLEYENQGFSISAYTYSKLNFMSQNGSLFVDHLVKESKILFDSHKQLEIILKNHKSKKPGLKQFQDNKNYFKLLKFVPNFDKGFGWFCDCAYVGIRNYLILKSAERGNLNFSYLILLDELKNDNLITDKEIEILRELRVIKRNYREKIDDQLPSKNYTLDIIKIFIKLNLVKDIKIKDKIEFQQFVKSSILNIDLDHYQKLRLIEIYYYINGEEDIKIEKIICNPQFYASLFKKEKYVLNIIKKISKPEKHHPTVAKRNC